jgi:putative endonuclease
MKDKKRAGIKSQETGSLGENLAATFLSRKGHTIVARNYRKPWGELDIVTTRMGIFHIIEVKTIRVDSFSRERSYEPQELVDRRKLRKIARTAALYMEDVAKGGEYQIDVVAVLLNEEARVARCKYIEQVLEDNL